VKPTFRAKLWTPTVIRGILTNEAYLGDLVWNKVSGGKFFGVADCRLTPRDGDRRRVKNRDTIRRVGRHEPLVDRELFDRVQTLLVERQRSTTPKQGGGNFVLTSLLRCGHCGKPMCGETIRCRTSGLVLGYICSGYTALGKQVCNHNRVEEAPLAKAIARKLRENLLNPETLTRLDEAIRREAERTGGGSVAEVARLTAQLADLEKQATAAARKFLLVEDERASRLCKKALDDLTAEKDRIERALAEAEDRRFDRGDQEDLIERARGLMHRFDEVMHKGTPPEQRAFLRSVIDHVDLYFGHRTVGRKTFCTFVRGVIYVKKGILPSSYLLGSSRGTCLP
jgi:site-specific DNA recombinase